MSKFRHSPPPPDGQRDLPAELTLRFGAERLPGRVHWPAAVSAPPLIFLLAGAGIDNTFGPSLSSRAEAIVISFPSHGDVSGDRLETAAFDWVADHASDLGADPAALLVAGVYAAGGHAARLAVTARDHGWPELNRQLLVHPRFDPAWVPPRDAGGTAPATIVTSPPVDERLAAYATRLLAAGIDVDEIHLPNRVLPREAQLDKLVRSLRLGDTPHSPK